MVHQIQFTFLSASADESKHSAMEAGQKLSKTENLQSGMRRSRAAAFGDDTTDESVGSASRGPGQYGPDEQAVSTSSRATVVCNKGEKKSLYRPCARHTLSRGPEPSRDIPSSQTLVCLGPHRW